jgi:cell division septum initiation protein DivIVA
MTESTPQFRVARRGYEPAEVDRAVARLTTEAEEARQRAAALESRLHELEQQREGGEGVAVETASFAHLGERVGQILALADEEAGELRERARHEIAGTREEAEAAGRAVREEADHYATQRRSEADTEAARILEDAKRTADDRIDTADRDAAARLQEAEAVYEDQRAKAAKAAADFETTLAHRRKLSEEEFAVQMEEARGRLEDLERQIERSRAEADAERSEAASEAQRLVQEAQQQATALVTEAKTTAARVRADSERELAAASQRRDAINSQLSNVRQMLTTLTGSAPAALMGEDFGAPEEGSEDAEHLQAGDLPDEEAAREHDDEGADDVGDPQESRD